MSWPWSELGLDGPASLEEVRRAYAQRVKEVHPEEDPEGFQRLHTAYQQARQAARRARKTEQTGRTQPPPQSHPPVPPQPQENGKDSLDFETLLNQETEEEPRPEPQEPRLDFETLLNQETEEEPRPKPQEPRLDFETLLNQEAEEEPQPEPREPELDFDTLLHQEEAGEEAQEDSEKQKQQSHWDFQRLFDEEDTRRRSGGQDVSLTQALELVEMLFEEGASHQDWQRFLISGVFFRVKWNPRFMAALAGAFQAEPLVDQRIREAVCEAYGFRSGHVPREHRAFYEAVSGQTAQPEKGKKGSWRRRHPGLFIVAIVMSIFFLLPAGIGLGAYLFTLPDRLMAEKISQYIEEDVGYPVDIQYAGDSQLLFYLPVQQESFTAWPEGKRDLSQNKLGYGTDLGNHLLTRALEDFVDEQGYPYEVKPMNEQGQYIPSDQLPAIYGISTDLFGETEFLTALWEEMDRLSQEKWYVLWQPVYQVQMEVWNMPYFTYHSSDGPFPGEEIISHYQEKLPVELVSYLVEGCELRELDFGDRAYHLEDLGTITLHEDDYRLVGGVEEATGETTRIYLYNLMYLISIPAAEFAPDMSHTDYTWLLMGDKISKPENDLPWPRLGICRE